MIANKKGIDANFTQNILLQQKGPTTNEKKNSISMRPFKLNKFNEYFRSRYFKTILNLSRTFFYVETFIQRETVREKIIKHLAYRTDLTANLNEIEI